MRDNYALPRQIFGLERAIVCLLYAYSLGPLGNPIYMGKTRNGHSRAKSRETRFRELDAWRNHQIFRLQGRSLLTVSHTALPMKGSVMLSAPVSTRPEQRFEKPSKPLAVMEKSYHPFTSEVSIAIAACSPAATVCTMGAAL